MAEDVDASDTGIVEAGAVASMALRSAGPMAGAKGAHLVKLTGVIADLLA